MEADWEVEIGGGAPVLDATWPGFVDLREQPERIADITEAAAFPPLARLLCALNAAGSPVWTTKCDLWEQPSAVDSEQLTLACYIDLLPCAGRVFAEWKQAEIFCRICVARLANLELPNCQVELIVRQALAAEKEGYGITAYCSGTGKDRESATYELTAAMDALADSILSPQAPTTKPSKLQ